MYCQPHAVSGLLHIGGGGLCQGSEGTKKAETRLRFSVVGADVICTAGVGGKDDPFRHSCGRSPCVALPLSQSSSRQHERLLCPRAGWGRCPRQDWQVSEMPGSAESRACPPLSPPPVSDRGGGLCTAGASICKIIHGRRSILLHGSHRPPPSSREGAHGGWCFPTGVGASGTTPVLFPSPAQERGGGIRHLMQFRHPPPPRAVHTMSTPPSVSSSVSRAERTSSAKFSFNPKDFMVACGLACVLRLGGAL